MGVHTAESTLTTSGRVMSERDAGRRPGDPEITGPPRPSDRKTAQRRRFGSRRNLVGGGGTGHAGHPPAWVRSGRAGQVQTGANRYRAWPSIGCQAKN